MTKPYDRMTEAELRHHQCGRKKLYRTREAAKRVLRMMRQAEPTSHRGNLRNKIVVYSCPWALYDDGPHYHIGHRPTRKDHE